MISSDAMRSEYEELYEKWRSRAMSEGFVLNEFREHFGRYVEVSNVCGMTKALGAKLAYLSLCRQRQEECEAIKKEMENVLWLY